MIGLIFPGKNKKMLCKIIGRHKKLKTEQLQRSHRVQCCLSNSLIKTTCWNKWFWSTFATCICIYWQAGRLMNNGQYVLCKLPFPWTEKFLHPDDRLITLKKSPIKNSNMVAAASIFVWPFLFLGWPIFLKYLPRIRSLLSIVNFMLNVVKCHNSRLSQPASIWQKF